MKTRLCMIFAVALTAPLLTAETFKPSVEITVKKKVLDSDHKLIGLNANSSEKTLTLRVVLSNTSDKPLTGATLDGAALIREQVGTDKFVRNNALGTFEIPDLLPNASFTCDLGSIILKSYASNRHEFEQKLEAWKVSCTINGAVVGESINGDYAELEALVEKLTPLAFAGTIPDNMFQ